MTAPASKARAKSRRRDGYDAAPDELSWRIDNSKEIEMVRKLERALLPNTGSDRENNTSEEARPRRISPRTIEEQRKARALLRDLVDAGDDGIPIGNLIFGPRDTEDGHEVHPLRVHARPRLRAAG